MIKNNKTNSYHNKVVQYDNIFENEQHKLNSIQVLSACRKCLKEDFIGQSNISPVQLLVQMVNDIINFDSSSQRSFAALQEDSIVCVFAVVIGSTKFVEWFTVKWCILLDVNLKYDFHICLYQLWYQA